MPVLVGEGEAGARGDGGEAGGREQQPPQQPRMRRRWISGGVEADRWGGHMRMWGGREARGSVRIRTTEFRHKPPQQSPIDHSNRLFPRSILCVVLRWWRVCRLNSGAAKSSQSINQWEEVIAGGALSIQWHINGLSDSLGYPRDGYAAAHYGHLSA